MPTYAGLLRGVNVGGNRKMAMADLRAVHAGLGHRDVRTYIQSGNVVFASDETDEAALVEGITDAIAARFGFTVDLVVRRHEELAAVVEAGPYTDGAVDPRFVNVTFLDRRPEVDPSSVIDADAFAPDEFVLIGREIHQLYPSGLGRSKLPAALERALGGHVATTRNWRTVVRLRDMTSEG